MSFHPQTPQSPSRFSPITTDLSSSIISSVTSTATTLPTPAHSVNGSLSTQLTELAHELFGAMDHETPGKRKRSSDDVGNREHKKVHIERAPVSIDRLHMDVGPMYMLGRNPRPLPVVDTSEDLFKMFDLTATASKVARVDEKGEKKPLRKSYKSYLKTLKIDGHFEPVKREAADAGHLLSGLCEVPEQEWHVHFVQGREVESGMSQDVLDLLDNACTMNKGNVNSIWNPSVLGDLAPGKVAGPMKGRETAPGTPMGGGYPAGTVARPSALSQVRSALDLNRPRKNKKRALGDAGFEGFGEGAQDDDDVGMETGYSTADGDERAPVQKRRKKNPGGAPSPFQSVRPAQGYGPNLVGV